jgi:golgin subfamily B member 1
VQSYRQLADLDPTNKQALDALERLYLSREDWKSLDETLVKKGRVAGSVAEEVELWHQIGEIRRDYLADAEGAIGAYREALALDASDRKALVALKALYRGGERYRELVEILTQELDLGGPEDVPVLDFRLPLLYEVAAVQEKHLSDREQAIATYNTTTPCSPRPPMRSGRSRPWTDSTRRRGSTPSSSISSTASGRP